ncbi:MAG: hypothetical protein IJV64_10505 [Oscillospiraceae bacterium]|nr:hypothetical protein [Oscillospiraceae bacterium]
MARELIKFSNDKKGFIALLIVEGVVALWALSATCYAITRGRTSTMIYGAVTMFAAFYIFGRSLRSFHNMTRKEKEKKEEPKHE